MQRFTPWNLAVGVILTVLAVSCVGFLTALTFAEPKEIAGILAAILGGIIGAFGAAGAVYLTFDGQRKLEKDKTGALIHALWNDACYVQDFAYREAQWWRNEMQDRRFGATEERIFDHLQCAVLDGNLHRIGDIPPRTADALLAMRAGITIVRSTHKVFYTYEDKIIGHVAGNNLSEEEGRSTLSSNKEKTFHGLCQLCSAARQAILLLDPDGVFDKEREATFSQVEWAKRGPEYRAMNDFADGVLHQQPTGAQS